MNVAAVAECPLTMAVSVQFAIRRALEALRRDIGLPDTFIDNGETTTVSYFHCVTLYTSLSLKPTLSYYQFINFYSTKPILQTTGIVNVYFIQFTI